MGVAVRRIVVLASSIALAAVLPGPIAQGAAGIIEILAPQPGETVYGPMVVDVKVSQAPDGGTVKISAVEVLLDGVVVGSASSGVTPEELGGGVCSNPSPSHPCIYSVSVDSTAYADGTHSVAARTTGKTKLNAGPFDVSFANTLDTSERLDADLQAGIITLDEFAELGFTAVTDPDALPERYQDGETIPPDTVVGDDELLDYLVVWEQLSAATQASILDQMEQQAFLDDARDVFGNPLYPRDPGGGGGPTPMSLGPTSGPTESTGDEPTANGTTDDELTTDGTTRNGTAATSEAATQAQAAGSGTTIVEFSLGYQGVSTADYVEVASAPSASLAAYSLVAIDGDRNETGLVRHSQALGTTDSRGLWLTSSPQGPYVSLPEGTLTLAVIIGPPPAVGTDLDADDDGTLDSIASSDIVDSVAVDDGDRRDEVYSSTVLGTSLGGVGAPVRNASLVKNRWYRNEDNGAGVPGIAGDDPDSHEALNTPGAANCGPNLSCRVPGPSTTRPFQVIFDMHAWDTKHGLLWVDAGQPGGVGNNGQHDALDRIIPEIDGAWAFLAGAGWEMPSETLNVTIRKEKSAGRVTGRTDMRLQRQPDLKTVASRHVVYHEMFHISQYQYVSTWDRKGRRGVRWWLEASARWGQRYIALGRGQNPEDNHTELPKFLAQTNDDLASFGDGEHYGAFIFADFLEERPPAQGPAAVQATWEKLGEPTSLNAPEAITAAAPGALGIPEFWWRIYDIASPGSWTDLDRTDWEGVAPDSVLDRFRDVADGETVIDSRNVESGGAAMWEVYPLAGTAGRLDFSLEATEINTVPIDYRIVVRGCAGGDRTETTIVPPGNPVLVEIPYDASCDLVSVIATQADFADSRAQTALWQATYVELPVADLVATVDPMPNPVPPGTTLTYTITVENLGPEAVDTFTLTHALDPATPLNGAATDPACTQASPLQPVECELGPLPVGGTVDVTIAVDVPLNQVNEVVTETQTSGANDPTTTPVATTVPIQATAELALAVVPNPVSPVAGDTVIFTFDTTNNGPTSAPDAELVIQRPPELTAWSWPANCIVDAAPNSPIVCDLGEIAAADVATVIVDAQIPAGTSPLPSPLISGDVTSSAVDPDPSNNHAEVVVATTADLVVTMSIDPFPVNPGDRVLILVTVTNNGPATAAAVVLDVRLPTSFFNLSYPASCDVTAIPGQVLCQLGDMAAGDSIVVDITADVPAGADLTGEQVTASVSSPTPDPDTGSDGALTGPIGGSNLPFPCTSGCNTAGSYGDPHLVTFDRLGYDLQTVGELVLLESDDGQVVVQVRHQPWFASTRVSIDAAVAALVNGRRVGIYAGGVVKIDGVDVSIASGDSYDLGNGAAVYRTASYYTIAWPGTDAVRPRLDARVRSTNINLTAHLPPSYQGQVSGLLGNDNGDLADEFALRDGTVLPRPISSTVLYNVYANSWRITQAESLFDYGPGESTDTFTDLTFPSSVVTLADLSAEDRALAEAICRGAGVTDAVVLQACILDVGLTGDSTFVTGALGASTPVAADTGVYFADFEDGTAAGWSASVVSTTEAGGRQYLGPLSAGTNTLSLTDLPPHTGVLVAYDLYVLGGWDGNDGPDGFTAGQQGGSPLLATTFSNTTATQDYPTAGSPAQSGAAEVGTLGSYGGGGSAVYRIEHTFPHWEADLVLDFTGTGLSAVDNEFWGLDNVEVQLTQLPPDVFTIAPVETVTNGAPGPGAGNIEQPRAEDHYVFDVLATDRGILVDAATCLAGSRYTVEAPDGTILLDVTCRDIEVQLAPGRYLLRVHAPNGTTGIYGFTAYVIPAEDTDVATVGGPPVTVSTGTPGQNAVVTFDAGVGQRASMAFTSDYGVCDLHVSVTAPSGAPVWSSTCIASLGFFDTVALPEAGTYTVLVDPQDAATGSSTITVYDVPADVTDVASVGGASVTVSTGTPGQNAVVTFDAGVGQNVQLTADQSTYGVCGLAIAVTGPSGQSTWSTTCFGASTTFGPTALPETGTYTIGLDPQDEATGSVRLTLTEVP